MKDDTFRLCRKCGQPIAVIKEKIYRNIIVDAEAVEVKADPLGDNYIRWVTTTSAGTVRKCGPGR